MKLRSLRTITVIGTIVIATIVAAIVITAIAVSNEKPIPLKLPATDNVKNVENVYGPYSIEELKEMYPEIAEKINQSASKLIEIKRKKLDIHENVKSLDKLIQYAKSMGCKVEFYEVSSDGKVKKIKVDEDGVIVTDAVTTCEWDIYAWPVPAGTEMFRAAILWDEFDNDLDLYVYDPTGALAASSTRIDTLTEEVGILFPIEGTWYVAIHGYYVVGVQAYYLAMDNRP